MNLLGMLAAIEAADIQMWIAIVAGSLTIGLTVEGIAEKRRKKRDQELVKKLDPLTEVCQTFTEDYENFKEVTTANYNEIIDNINKLSEQSYSQTEQILSNELSRIKSEIMRLAARITQENNYKLSDNEFSMICELYDTYTSLGGNSYIEYEFKLIKEYKEKQERK